MKSPQFKSHSVGDNRHLSAFSAQVKNQSDVLTNYFLGGYFIAGLLLSFYYDTWLLALGMGSISMLVYYSAKFFLPYSDFYQYVLGVVLGIFMAQFIFQMHGMFEMHLTAFIGSALLATYQKWKLQIPLFIVVILHHALFGYLQYIGFDKIYFTQWEYMDMQTFVIHILLTGTIFFLCGLGAYQFHKYSSKHMELNFQLGRLQEEEQQKKAMMQMRDHLKASNLRLTEAEKIARMGNWERNFTNNMLIWSDEMYRIFDIDNTGFNVSYDAYLNFIHPDDRESVNEIFKRYHSDKQPFTYECRIVTMKGITKIIYVRGRVVVNDENTIIKTYGVVQDITDRKMIEESVQKSEANLRTVFDNTDSAYVLIDKDLNVVFFNQKASQFAADEFNEEITAGKCAYKMFPEHRQNFLKDTFGRVLRGATINYEINYPQPDGTERWYSAKYFPVADNNKNIFGVIFSLTDITERKQNEERITQSEKYNRNIFNLSTVGLALARMDGTIVDANQAYAKIIGRSIDEATKLSYFQITPEKYSEKENEILNELELNGHYNAYEKEYLHSDGRLVPVRMSGSILERKGENLILLSVEDITESRKAQEEILLKNAELQKANVELESIVYSASHDMRSQLTSVLSLLSSIEDETKEPDTMQHAIMIRTRIKRLDDFVVNILNYSRSNCLNVSNDQISFSEMVKRSVSEMHNITVLPEIDFQIHVNESGDFYSDRQLIKTILDNLIGNAIKFYNPEIEKSFISITVNSNALHAEITIEDNGLGIAEEHHEKIFNMFYRFEDSTPGSGLGLYLVKEIIEKLNGSIHLESEPGKGTKFVITLKNKKNGRDSATVSDTYNVN